MPEAARKKNEGKVEKRRESSNKTGRFKGSEKEVAARTLNKQGGQPGETGAAGGEVKATESQDLNLFIENYDQLNVNQVAKKLKSLSPDQLEMVKCYEQEHKNRKTLLEQMDRAPSMVEKVDEPPDRNLPENYDQLNVEQAAEKLGSLSSDQVRQVKSHEQEHKTRKTLLDQMDAEPSTDAGKDVPPSESTSYWNWILMGAGALVVLWLVF